jgi:protein gp37
MNGPNNRIGYCDFTYNPLTGCLNNCPYCYAREVSHGRVKPLYLSNQNVMAGDRDDPFAIRWWPSRLEEPLKVKTPSRIFVTDMGDLFGDRVPLSCLESVFEVVRAADWHTFIFLTKYPWNLRRVSEWPKNAWVGVTATDFRMADTALYRLERVDAPVRFISAEPLLDRLNDCPGTFLHQMFQIVNWIIIGAQTKPDVPPERQWVEEILREADKAGVPVYIKGRTEKYFPDLMNRPLHEFPEAAVSPELA